MLINLSVRETIAENGEGVNRWVVWNLIFKGLRAVVIKLENKKTALWGGMCGGGVAEASTSPSLSFCRKLGLIGVKSSTILFVFGWLGIHQAVACVEWTVKEILLRWRHLLNLTWIRVSVQPRSDPIAFCRAGKSRLGMDLSFYPFHYVRRQGGRQSGSMEHVDRTK